MWTQCWLNYNDCMENSLSYADYFSSLYVEGFKKDEIITNAFNELKTAGEKLFSIKPEVDFSLPAHGIAFVKSEDEALGEEGYRIYVKDGVAAFGK